MKGLEAFFGKLKRGGETAGLNEELKETSNILKKILKLEKKEAKAAGHERVEKDKERRREVRKKKRNVFDLQNPFDNLRNSKPKGKKDNGFSWVKMAAMLGLAGLTAFAFREQIATAFGELKDRAWEWISTEIPKMIQESFQDLGKFLKDQAWEKLIGEEYSRTKINNEIAALPGESQAEKLAQIEKQRGNLNIGNDPLGLKGRQLDKLEQQLRYGSLSGIGSTGVDNINQGDLQTARRQVRGSDSKTLAQVDSIIGMTSERGVIQNRVFELQEILEATKDPKERMAIIDILNAKYINLRKLSAQIASALGESQQLLTNVREAKTKRLAAQGITVPEIQPEIESITPSEMPAAEQLQKGGMAGKSEAKLLTGDDNPSVLDAQRYLATTDAVDLVQKRQEGGLVLFQGHGDVPIGHAAPGTDGPGTSITGKFKPTAEQYFVNKVNVAAEKLAKSEGIDIRYQRPTGRYANARQNGANWQMIDDIRNKGGSAVEIHFDAYGLDNGKMIKGFRGLLADKHPVRSEVDESLRDKFGIHPSSGKGYGSFMLELDHLGKAQSNVNNYARMLVDAVKSVKGTEPAEVETDDTTKAELDEAKVEVQRLRELLEKEPDPKKRLNYIDEIVQQDNRIREIDAEIKREIESRGGPSVLEQEQKEQDDKNKATDKEKNIFSLMEGMGPALANITQYTKVLLGGISESLGIDLKFLLGSYEDNLSAGGQGNGETEGPSGVDDQGTNSFSAATTSDTTKGVKVAKALMADLGLTKDQASGIVGNFLYESAGMKPDIREGGPYSGGSYSWEAGRTATPAGYGWAQWSFDRHDKFVNEHLGGFGGPNGVSTRKATDADNYAFLLKEFRSTEKLAGRTDGRPDMPKLDVDNTTSWFRKHWERAGVPADSKRITEASAVRQKLQTGGMVGGKLREQPQATMGASTPGARRPSAAVSAPTYQRPSIDLPGGSQNVSKLNVNVSHVRMQEANESYRTKYKAKAQSPIVIINNSGSGGGSAPMPRVPKASAPSLSGGGGLNMVQASDALHRINSGARF